MKILAGLTGLVLYFIFSFFSALAGLIGLAALPFSTKYTANVMHSMDMLLAALFGWNGRSTVSKECGRELAAPQPCRFCRVLCAVLSYKVFGRWYVLEADHCKKEAAK